MPRYFFHLFDSIHAHDEEGIELPDIDAARVHAIRGAREVLASELVGKGEVDLGGWIVVETGPGQQELVLSFAEALTVTP